MFKRRKKLINKKFQLKITFTIISITLIAFLIVIAIIGINATRNSQKITETQKELKEAIKVEDDIVNAFIEYSKRITNNEFTLRTKVMSDDHTEKMNVIKKYVSFLEIFEEQNFLLITAIISIVLIQGIFLYFYLIRLTHRISGPIYVINRHVKDIIDGKDPKFRELREKDEFKEFYEQFVLMAEKFKKDK